jgi:ParB/RepB/Spo0J family partition protein
VLFRKKTKKEVKQEAETPEVDNTSPVEPYEDEPDSWKSLTDEQKADVWYHLALTNESSDPGTHQPGGDDFLWYMDAASCGNRCAQYTLGKMYYTGVMTAANIFQSGLWLSKSSAAGCPFADYELGKMCAYGIGMPENKETARAYYKKAYEAFQSIDNARQNKAIELKLAVMCENDLVDQANPETARYWRDLISGRNKIPAPAPPEEQIIEKPAAPEPQSNEGISKIDLNKGNLVNVPVEYIIPADDNKYAANDSDEDLYALAMSIQANGLINPITLNQKSKTKYQIISGERRYRAITKFLGWETIPSIVHFRLSSNKAQLMLHSANLDVRDYTTGQKLQFYIEVEKLLRKMQQSGEYDGTIQKGISEAMHMSMHQIRKYQKIVESLSKKQVKQVINGNMNLEQAYSLAKLHVVRQDVELGRTSAFEPNTDADEGQEAGGRTSAFEPDTDADEGQEDNGRTSAFEPDTDADEGQETGGRKSAFAPDTDMDEGQETGGRKSAFEPDMDADEEQNPPGRTSDFEDPECYQEAISLLPDLPVEPGETCAVVNATGVQSGYVDRIEIYDNALLVSVLVDSIRMPFPVSMIGKTIFIGSGCFEQAKRAM